MNNKEILEIEAEWKKINYPHFIMYICMYPITDTRKIQKS